MNNSSPVFLSGGPRRLVRRGSQRWPPAFAEAAAGKPAPPGRGAAWLFTGVVLAGLVLAGTGLAALPTGEAVVAARTGRASVRVFSGPVHEGRKKVRELFEGSSFGENTRVMTAADGRLSLVCSPGAILCVAPRTEATVQQLRHTADGLPRSEDDLIRRIHLDLHKGRIRVQAGTPIPTLDIRITTPMGRVQAHGGSFVVAQDRNRRWNVYCDAYELTLVSPDGESVVLKAGEAAWFWIDRNKRFNIRHEGVAINGDLHEFELCNAYFEDLEPFIERDRRFDRAGLEKYLGGTRPLVGVDDAGLVTDVSPSDRLAQTLKAVPALPAGAGGLPGGRWEERRIWTWYDQLGPVKGVNYIPRTAVNSVEMWMKETFDPETIDEELGWARGLGYNSIRVQLQFVVWQADPEGFLERVDQLLDLAAGHGLRMVPVLFDDLNRAGQPPRIGPQPEPVPDAHNARWVSSPAPEAVTDRSQWPELEQYVKGVMGEFRRDGRILYWDLYNNAGNSGLWEKTLPLMDQTFNWARSVDAAQPLAVSAWRKFGSAMAARKLERSDLVTFQSFESVETVEAQLQLLQRYQRPIICSDWLVRQAGSDFEQLLPLFAAYRVGWFNCGLVSGKTQLQVQEARFRSEQKPDLWQQGMLHADGTPYDRKEAELVQGFRYLEAAQ